MKLFAALLAVAVTCVMLFFLRPWAGEPQPTSVVREQTDSRPVRSASPASVLAAAPEETRRVEAAASEPESVDPSTPALLKVRVVNEDGDAVAQADAYAAYAEPGKVQSGAYPHQGRTDSAGLCEFEVPSARALVLHVFSFYESSREEVEVPALAPGELRELTVVVKTKDDETFVGRVVSEDGGLPLPGVAVHVDHQVGVSGRRNARPLATGGEPVAITDANGLFEVPTRSWSNTVATFTAAGWSPQRAGLIRSATSEQVFQVRMRRGARVTGQLSAHDGTALEVQATTRGYLLMEGPIAVMLSRSDVLFRAAVDATGHFALEDLPSRVALEFRVVSGRSTLFRLPEPLTLEPDEAHEVEWALQGAGALRGRVVDVDAQPVADQVVWLLTPRQARPGLLQYFSKPAERTTSDAAGRFAFLNVQPGTWTVGLAPPQPSRGRPAQSEAYAPLAVAAQVPADGSDVEVELVVYRDLYVEGVLRDPDGQTVRASVWLHSVESRLFFDADSDEDGIFRVGPLPSGPYQLTGVTFLAPRFAKSEPIEVHAGDTGVEVFLRRGAALSGRVLGLEGTRRAGRWSSSATPARPP